MFDSVTITIKCSDILSFMKNFNLHFNQLSFIRVQRYYTFKAKSTKNLRFSKTLGLG